MSTNCQITRVAKRNRTAEEVPQQAISQLGIFFFKNQGRAQRKPDAVAVALAGLNGIRRNSDAPASRVEA